jgi:hypothetical protein
MCTANKVLIEKNRKYVSQLIDIVLYLSKQIIAFRGYKETSKSTNKGCTFEYFSFLNEII